MKNLTTRHPVRLFAASEDGITLIYSSSLKGTIGFVDIATLQHPRVVIPIFLVLVIASF